MNWQPIIGKNHPLYTPIRTKLEEISKHFLAKDNEQILEEQGFSLMGGAAGAAIFLSHYGAAFEDEQAFDKGLSLVETIFGGLGENAILDTHAGGLSGVAWMLEHIVQSDYIDCDTNMVLEDCDNILFGSMINNLQENQNWDFLHGALGNALYFIQRKNLLKAKEYVQAFFEEFEKLAETDPQGGLKWSSAVFPEEDKVSIVYNFALAHGMAAAIAIFGKALKRFPDMEIARRLLEQNLIYFRNHQNLFPNNFNIYPSWLAAEKEASDSSSARLAWCYGDPGIGAAMLAAGRNTDDKVLADEGLDLIRRGVEIRTVKESGVRDACLCHGTASLFHIYNRAYQYSQEEAFKEGAVFWIKETMKVLDNEQYPLGYFVYRIDANVFENSFLEGVSGLGLCLLATITEQEPDWDQALLIS